MKTNATRPNCIPDYINPNGICDVCGVEALVSSEANSNDNIRRVCPECSVEIDDNREYLSAFNDRTNNFDRCYTDGIDHTLFVQPSRKK